MWTYLCLLTCVVGGGVSSPQTYGLPLPTFSRETFVLQPAFRAAPVLSDVTSQTGQFENPSSPRAPFIPQGNVFTSNVQSPQSFNPSFQSNSQTNFAFQRNQFTNPSFQTGDSFQSDFPQPQTSTFQNNQFNRPPVRSGIENHPFLHSHTLELLPPLQHVVGTKYPRVEAGVGFRFPTSQLLNTTPPSNLI